MKQPVLVAAALLLSGCGALPFGSRAPLEDAPAGLQLTIQPRDAAPGATATLTLLNQTSEPIGYNLCFGGLEQHRGQLWVPALTHDKPCEQAFATLQAGQQTSAETPLAAALEGGDYRYVTRVQVPLGSFPETQVRSDSFRIDGRGG